MTTKAPTTSQQAAAGAQAFEETKVEPRPVTALPGEKKAYDVTFNGETVRVQAVDQSEARALANDARGSWPSPKAVKVVEATTREVK